MTKSLKFSLSFVVTLLVFAALAYFAGYNSYEVPANADQFEKKVTIQTSDGQIHDFNVELAVTLQEVQKGLMNRDHLPRDSGMLFLFKENKPRTFWMKNTFIPLDIIFLKSDGKIHHIVHNATPMDETALSSNGPVQAVLEINGGMSKKLNIRKGDTVRHSFFGNAL